MALGAAERVPCLCPWKTEGGGERVGASPSVLLSVEGEKYGNTGNRRVKQRLRAIGVMERMEN